MYARHKVVQQAYPSGRLPSVYPVISTKRASCLSIRTHLRLEPDLHTLVVNIVATSCFAVDNSFLLRIKLHIANRAVVFDRLLLDEFGLRGNSGDRGGGLVVDHFLEFRWCEGGLVEEFGVLGDFEGVVEDLSKPVSIQASTSWV